MMKFGLAGGRYEGFCTLGAFPGITASCHFDIKHRNALVMCVLGLFFPTLLMFKIKKKKMGNTQCSQHKNVMLHVGSLACLLTIRH